MKKCHSSTVMGSVIIFSVYVLSQIKLSSITKIITIISVGTDQGTHSVPHGSSSLASPITCDRSHENYDLCSINGPVVLDPKQSTFYAIGRPNAGFIVEKVRPYPQKNASQTIKRIKEVTLTSGPQGPSCMVQHKASALVFSVGGYTWNFFHAFIDGFIPLFITVNSISLGQDHVLVIADAQDWWVRKYEDLFHSFSKHPIVFLDNDTSTHCFPSVTVGLISHGFMTIDSKMIPNHKTTQHFHALLKKTYCNNTLPSIPPNSLKPRPRPRPRLVLVTRTGGVGRVILNQAEVVKVAEEEGFEVIKFEPKHDTPLQEACDLMSSSHVVVGVHGAALTNALFLRPRSVFIQVVGIGLENVAELCYGRFTRDMEFEYMEYKVGVEETSLVDRYGTDDVIVKNPDALQLEWYDSIMEVYLRQQNVRLDIVKLRGYLKKAYEKARIKILHGALPN